jgi:hypothetical protein
MWQKVGLNSKLETFVLTSLLGFTLSGNGTSHRHINYESKHIMLFAPSYDSLTTPVTTPATRFLGISSAADHASETQFKGWQDTFAEMLAVYNESLSQGLHDWQSLFDLIAKLVGASTDHATNQKKLVGLLKGWKEVCN